MKKTISKFIFLFLIISGIATSNERNNFLIFAGSTNKSLAENVANKLGVDLGKVDLSTFNDKEINIQILESVRGRDIYIIQSTSTVNGQSVNDSLMELYLMTRALKRASAKSVTAVIPYYGYARQDRKTAPRVPISAADVAMMLEAGGVDRVISLDLHCGQIQGFFHNAPVDNLYSASIFAHYFANIKLKDPVVISPDAGGVARAKLFKETLAKFGTESGFGIIIKQRKEAGVIDQVNLVGDVKGKDAIIVDDMCDTGGTLVKAAQELKKFGANRVYACITHPVFSKDAIEKISESDFTQVLVTDTIPLRQEPPKNLKQLSVSTLLAEVIDRINKGNSISDVFTQ